VRFHGGGAQLAADDGEGPGMGSLVGLAGSVRSSGRGLLLEEAECCRRWRPGLQSPGNLPRAPLVRGLHSGASAPRRPVPRQRVGEAAAATKNSLGAFRPATVSSGAHGGKGSRENGVERADGGEKEELASHVAMQGLRTRHMRTWVAED
jgi:hypothetical protein